MDLLHTTISRAQPVFWTNPLRASPSPHTLPSHFDHHPLGLHSIQEAQARFERFAPLLAQLFPELQASQGRIESALIPIAAMQQALGLSPDHGPLWLKADHQLAVAGSIKARGGFHEVMEVTERIAQEHQLLGPKDSYLALLAPRARQVFARYQIAVGSTGNLGMSIGMLAAALGLRAVVHMSSDAKDWKKQRLRLAGVQVVEHAGDYARAVSQGRQQARSDPLCHFVDDERSTSLFLGYAASAFYLQQQLQEQGILVDEAHPLLVYIPCGVGGAPSGIAWGLHHIFGSHVYCYFAEPVQSPCFLLAMLSPGANPPSVYDYGLNNHTEADGLAVPCASELAVSTMQHVVAGAFTVDDATLFQNLRMLDATQGLRIEPSAAAGFSGPLWLKKRGELPAGATHLVWTTGGSLVPAEQYQRYLDWQQPI